MQETFPTGHYEKLIWKVATGMDLNRLVIFVSYSRKSVSLQCLSRGSWAEHPHPTFPKTT